MIIIERENGVDTLDSEGHVEIHQAVVTACTMEVSSDEMVLPLIAILEKFMVEVTLMHWFRSLIGKVDLVKVFKVREHLLLHPVQSINLAGILALNQARAHFL